MWQIQTAKNRFSELIDESQKNPQWITKHGHEVAVVLSVEAYRALLTREQNLFDFLASSPLRGLDLDSAPKRSRKKSKGRKFDVPA